MDILYAMLDEGKRGDDDEVGWLFRGFWECHECGRVAVNWPERSTARVKWYVPEDGKPGYLSSPEEDVLEKATRPDPTGLLSP